MKKVLLLLVMAFVAMAGYSQEVLGKWLTEAGNAQVEIYLDGNKLNGKIVWLEKGPDTKDTHNPDPKLQSRKLMGVHILSGLKKQPRTSMSARHFGITMSGWPTMRLSQTRKR